MITFTTKLMRFITKRFDDILICRIKIAHETDFILNDAAILYVSLRFMLEIIGSSIDLQNRMYISEI